MAKTFLFLACAMLFASSAFAHWRPSRWFWRDRTTSSRPSARDLRGIVESVDARRNTFTISDANGTRVVVKRRDKRVDPQPGDHVSISGPWNRDTGFLEGYSIKLLE